jgi:DNA-binding response OmpR family regulator
MARVLVIDDDRETRETLEEQLRRAGHGVQTTATATDGVRLARERRPDVVLLDAELPDMSPAGVCRALEAEMSTRGVPVVVMLAIDQIAPAPRSTPRAPSSSACSGWTATPSACGSRAPRSR